MSFDGNSKHYDGAGLEVMDVIEGFKLGFCLGNVVKYVLRCGHKGGEIDAINDLKKAVAYLQREIERRERECKTSIYD